MEHSGDGSRDVLPKQYSARTGLYEYGGAAFTVSPDGSLIFGDWVTKGVFSLDPDSGRTFPVVQADPAVYYADFEVHPSDTRWVLALREDHHSAIVENTIVAIDALTKATHPVAHGADFYSHPRFNPDGTKVCWMQWNHPDMPWTGTELYIADWHNGKIGKPMFVAGKAGVESISQPRWGPDGALYFISDRTGYWQLYQSTQGDGGSKHIELKGLTDAEFATAEWWLGR